jgi:hypothetical protein
MSGFPPMSRAAGLGALIVAAFLGRGPAVAEESCDLKLRSAIGERRLISVDTLVDATLTTTDVEEKTVARSVASQQKATFAEETVSVDDAKRPVQVRLNCLSASIEERAAGDASGGVRRSPLQGRIVTVTREGNGWSVIPVGTDPLAADQAATLGRWLDLRLLLKEGAVKVGESWTVASPGQVATMLLGKDAGIPEVRCTLGRIIPGTPARAEVAVSVRLEKGKEGDENRLQGQLSGMIVVDLTAGQPLSFSLGGNFRAVQAARDANGNPVGKIDIQARKVEMKIGFEPVKP